MPLQQNEDDMRPNQDQPSEDSGPIGFGTSLKIGGNHGYRIDGDTASLNADLAIVHDDVHRTGWALQLWACENPHQGGSLSGVKVSETLVVLPSSPQQPVVRLEAETFANIPPDRRDYAMVLVLASGRPGAFEHVQDFANYPRREIFLVPRLEGTVGYSIEAGSVVLSVDRVCNPRPAGSLSGSLGLELWALAEPYSGGSLDGVMLAKADVDRIAGQCSLESIQCRAAFSRPPSGPWRLALVLREWTASGLVGRDWRNFAIAFVNAQDETSTHDSLPPDSATHWPPSHAQIATAAYLRYLARGSRPGDALADWLEAERELLNARKSDLHQGGSTP